jgi:hypothetical protein
MIKINENLFNRIDKKDIYPNIFIKNKEIKMRNRDFTTNSMDASPFEFSFSLEQNSNKIFNNKIYSRNLIPIDFNKNMYNSKLLKKYKQLFNRRNNDNIKNKLFNRISSMNNESMENSNNKEKKINTSLIKSFNKIKDKKDKNNNFLIIHKKIFVLGRALKNKASNINLKNKRTKETNSLIISDKAKRYKTVFIKCNMDKIKLKEKSQESVQKFELFSSKYSNKLEESKGTQTPRKLFTNDEIKKIEFLNNTFNDKYVNTDNSYKKNSLSVLLPKFIQMPNIENVKNFKKIYKPTFYCQKNDVKNKINLMLNKNKNNPFNKTILWNSHKVYKNRHKINVKNSLLNQINEKSNSKINRIKYISVNLNNLTKIPNRLIQVDKYGNQIKQFISHKDKKRFLSQSDSFHFLKKIKIKK